VDRDAERRFAERLPEVAARRGPGDRGAEGHVRRVEHAAHQRPARPAGRTRDAHRNALRLRHDQALPASFVEATPDDAWRGGTAHGQRRWRKREDVTETSTAPSAPADADAESAPAPTPFHDLQQFVALPRLGGLAMAPDGSRLVTTVATLNPKR